MYTMENPQPSKIPRPKESSGLLGRLSKKGKHVIQAGAFMAGLGEITDAVKPGKEQNVEERAKQLQDAMEVTQKKKKEDEEGDEHQIGFGHGERMG